MGLLDGHRSVRMALSRVSADAWALSITRHAVTMLLTIGMCLTTTCMASASLAFRSSRRGDWVGSCRVWLSWCNIPRRRCGWACRSVRSCAQTSVQSLRTRSPRRGVVRRSAARQGLAEDCPTRSLGWGIEVEADSVMRPVGVLPGDRALVEQDCGSGSRTGGTASCFRLFELECRLASSVPIKSRIGWLHTRSVRQEYPVLVANIRGVLSPVERPATEYIMRAKSGLVGLVRVFV